MDTRMQRGRSTIDVGGWGAGRRDKMCVSFGRQLLPVLIVLPYRYLNFLG